MTDQGAHMISSSLALEPADADSRWCTCCGYVIISRGSRRQKLAETGHGPVHADKADCTGCTNAHR